MRSLQEHISDPLAETATHARQSQGLIANLSPYDCKSPTLRAKNAAQRSSLHRIGLGVCGAFIIEPQEASDGPVRRVSEVIDLLRALSMSLLSGN